MCPRSLWPSRWEINGQTARRISISEAQNKAKQKLALEWSVPVISIRLINRRMASTNGMLTSHMALSFLLFSMFLWRNRYRSASKSEKRRTEINLTHWHSHELSNCNRFMRAHMWFTSMIQLRWNTTPVFFSFSFFLSVFFRSVDIRLEFEISSGASTIIFVFRTKIASSR